MYYLTKHNFSKLLNLLHMDIPMNYTDAYIYYYSEYRLASFDLDLHYFTKNEARALTIADQLVKDIRVISEKIQISRIEREQKKWVYNIVSPAFHAKRNCVKLHSDFENVPIPESCDEARCEEYRTYFLAEKGRYGYSANKIAPSVFCRKLKAHFNLSESVEDLEKNYFYETSYDNSDIIDFNKSLDFEKEASAIQSIIDIFKENTSTFTTENVRSAYYRQNNEVISQTERDVMKSIYKTRKQLVSRILNFYFQKLFKNGFDVPRKVLEIAGFKPCRCCS